MKNFLRKILPQGFFGAYHYVLAFVAACVYRFPARKLTVIGVTGTNGKTTTVHMMHAIFRHAGYAVCSASSVRFAIGEKEFSNMLKMTMAGPFVLQKFLRDAVQKGCRFAILEVTSEGILQHRHAFMGFDMAVLTNISPEHIERHGSFEAYLQAKSQIFKGAKRIVVNCDDDQAAYFLQGRAQEKYGYTFASGTLSRHLPRLKKLFVIENFTKYGEGSEFVFEGTRVQLSLPGEFNIRNAIESLIVAHLYGVEIKKAAYALGNIRTIPGRMEMVASNPVEVIVDYAHTPVALEEVYKTLHADGPEGKFICVLGATGGGRDKWKRPEFGKLAAAYCDYIILTNEDPYDEDPASIIAEVRAGVPQSFAGTYEEILDRREAIARALHMAAKGDVVAITGKGCEPYMVTGKGKIPWDDRAIVREELQTG